MFWVGKGKKSNILDFLKGTIPVDESLATPIPTDVRLALQSPRFRLPQIPSVLKNYVRSLKNMVFIM